MFFDSMNKGNFNIGDLPRLVHLNRILIKTTFNKESFRRHTSDTISLFWDKEKKTDLFHA